MPRRNLMKYYSHYKVNFIPKVEEFIEHKELISDFIGSLVNNGQIIQETVSSLLLSKTEAFCFCTLIEENAIAQTNDNLSVCEDKKNLAHYFDVIFEKIAENIDYKGFICGCNNSSFILQGDYKESPVVCADCEGAVPLYRLPKIRNSVEHADVLWWYNDYNNINDLWISDHMNRFTYKQLNNPNSQLAKNGRKICAAYEKATGKPFYYKLFYDDITRKKPVPNNCPLCGENWVFECENKVIDFKCDKCRLVADKNNYNK